MISISGPIGGERREDFCGGGRKETHQEERSW